MTRLPSVKLILPLIQNAAARNRSGTSVCLGSLNHSMYADLKQAGAGIYIIKFEIANPKKYAAMESLYQFDQRIANICHLAKTGWREFRIYRRPAWPNRRRHPHQFHFGQPALRMVAASARFIPGEETSLAPESMAGIDLTLNCMAVFSLMRPDWVIPSVSALNIAGAGTGYRRGLRTGANLVTINPHTGGFS